MSDDLVAFLRVRWDEAEAHAFRWHDLECEIYQCLGAGLNAMVATVAMFHEAPGAVCDCGGPALVLRVVEADRGLLGQYERLLRAHARHKATEADLVADIEREERTGDPGDGLSDVRARALRREADYLPAMLTVLKGWARAKAAICDDHPDYREEWRP